MKTTVVFAALLGALALASASDPSLPQPGSLRETCLLPIKQLRCTTDKRTGFLAGMRYGYGPIGEVNICSQGNSFQATWDMSPPTYRPAIQCSNNPPGGTFLNLTTSGQPSWSSSSGGKGLISEEQLMPYGSMITQVLSLTAPNPLGPKFGEIAALAFRYTNQDLAEAAEAGCITPEEQYRWAVCGNTDYANAYLFPGPDNPAPALVKLQAQYSSPLTEEGFPSFLGSFQGICSTRGGGYLGGDPVNSSKFFIKKLTKVCFSRLAHTITGKPPSPPSPPPEVNYDWDVPFTPCYWDKKDSKNSASLSCAASGQAVATGKYGVIEVDARDGHAYEVMYNDDDASFSRVRAASMFEGEEPEDVATVAAQEPAAKKQAGKA